MRKTGFVILLLGLSACGQIPGLDAAVEDDIEAGPYPELLPQRSLPTAQQGRLTDTSEAEIEGRGARLQRRAGNL